MLIYFFLDIFVVNLLIVTLPRLVCFCWPFRNLGRGYVVYLCVSQCSSACSKGSEMQQGYGAVFSTFTASRKKDD